jgi:hypothetical protein
MGWRDTVCPHCGYDFPPRGPDPLRSVRVILTLFTFVGGALLIGDAYAIAFEPDEQVVVVWEGRKAEVWRDVWAYEASTGKKWIGEVSSASAAPWLVVAGGAMLRGPPLAPSAGDAYSIHRIPRAFHDAPPPG